MLGRFAVDKGAYYRPGNNSVKPKAFMPKDGATSVFEVGALGHAERIAHGQEHFGNSRQKQVLGYCRIDDQEVLSRNLSIAPDVPPPLHANISGWPNDLDDQKALAADLAESATFVPA